MFPVRIGMTKDSRSLHKTKVGGAYTLFVFLLSIVYALVLILEPLKASNSINSSVVNQEGTGSISGISAGSSISETVTINGVEFQGTYDVKKRTEYIRNFTFSSSEHTYQPHKEGFQIAFEIPLDYDESLYFIEMVHFTIRDGEPSGELVEFDYCNITDFPEEIREELLYLNIQEMVCPYAESLDYSGNIVTSDSDFFGINIAK